MSTCTASWDEYGSTVVCGSSNGYHCKWKLCDGHNMQRRQGRIFTKLRVFGRTGCNFKECGENHHSLGLCSTHYRQQHDGRPLSEIYIPVIGCMYPNCQREHGALGLCKAHYKQQYEGRTLSEIRCSDNTVEQSKWFESCPSDNSCHIWKWSVDDQGYGVCGIEGYSRAHRVAWMLVNGSIPDGMYVLHSCPKPDGSPGGDNPSCCNPAHLNIGTHDDNMRQKMERSRQACAEGHGHSKMTCSSIKDVRDNCVPYSRTHGRSAFSRKYGVSLETIHNALTGTYSDNRPYFVCRDETCQTCIPSFQENAAYIDGSTRWSPK